MTHQEKLKETYRHMSLLGVSESTAAPSAWRLLWRLGVEVLPPLFIPSAPGALATGGVGLFWGLLMWALFWSRQGMPAAAMAVSALGAGALFGLIMGTYWRYLARKHGLPKWSDYTGVL